MTHGSNIDIEDRVENYFGDVLGKGLSLVEEWDLERFNNRYEDETVDEYLEVEEELDQGVVFHDGDEAVYVSNIKVQEGGDIYMNFEDAGDATEILHGLARRFVDYSESELGDWEKGVL
jgi:hypothetical protein